VQDGEFSPSPPYGVYRPDLGATGVSLVSTMSPDDPLQGLDNGDNESLASPYYAAISGTSMSSPTAAGVTALVVDAYVEEYGEAPTPETLFTLLEQEATVFDDTKHAVVNIGNGFIDATVANRITEVTDDPAGDGGNDENGQGDENQDDNAGEKEDNSDDGGDNGEGDDAGGGDDRAASRATSPDTSYGF